jgi:hypothetical protein
MNAYNKAHYDSISLSKLGYEELADSILNLLMEPVEFSIEYDAEQYVLMNQYGHAKLMHKRIVVSEFFGTKYKKAGL